MHQTCETFLSWCRIVLMVPMISSRLTQHMILLLALLGAAVLPASATFGYPYVNSAHHTDLAT
jgi:hypothetical protein